MKDSWVPAGWFSKNPKLISNGPFKLDRHPMYFGYLLLLIGVQVSFVNIGVILHIYTYMGYRKIVEAEESYLEQNIGKRYLLYKGKTRSIFA